MRDDSTLPTSPTPVYNPKLNDQWNIIAKNAKVSATERKYYQKYYAKVYISSKLIGSANTAYVRNKRKFTSIFYNFVPYDRRAAVTGQEVVNEMHTLIERLHKTFNSLPNNVFVYNKVDSIIFYFVDANTAFDWIHSLPADIAALIDKITVPDSQEAIDVVSSGKVFNNNKMGYRYKLLFREGNRFVNLDGLATYLTTLHENNEIHLSHRALFNLKNCRYYFRGGHLLCNDESLQYTINLLSPGIINRFEENVERYK